MAYMQAIITTLWTIWNHRNIVVHEGKDPNPMEVVLTAQSLSCKYKKSFINQPKTASKSKNQNQNSIQQQDNGK